MKTAISVPDETYAAVDQAAARLGISRSQFYARAAQRWIDAMDSDKLTAQINASLAEVDQSEDLGFVRDAAAKAFARSEW